MISFLRFRELNWCIYCERIILMYKLTHLRLVLLTTLSVSPLLSCFFFFFFFSSHLSQTQFTYQYITRTRHSNFWNKCRTFNFTIFWKKVSNRQQVDAVFPLISLSPSYSSPNHHHHHGVRLLRVIYTTTSEGQKKYIRMEKKN